MIETGASRDRIPMQFWPVLDAAIAEVSTGADDALLYVYGSVATGTAEPGRSDVDLLTVGVAAEQAAVISEGLSRRFVDLCRAVEVAAAQHSDFAAGTDEGYGGRVFLKHYCVHLAGPDRYSALPDFPADVRAARGFNGDIAQHVDRWRQMLADGSDPTGLGRRLARKTLLAVAGLVSMHDHTWTTDRARAAIRWGEIEPVLAEDLRTLLGWANGDSIPGPAEVVAALDGVVVAITRSFERSIGLWGW